MFLRTMQRVLVAGFFLASLSTAWAGLEAKTKKSARPEAQPRVHESHLASFRKSNKEIAKQYDIVQRGINELVKHVAQAADAAPRDKRKMEKKARSLRGKVTRERRKLDKLLKKKIAPVEKKYLSVKTKYDGLVAKAKEKEEKGDEKRAQKYHQEAAKIASSMSGSKRSLDLLYYHTFFKGEEVLQDGE